MRCSTKIAAVAALVLPCVSAASIADLPTCAVSIQQQRSGVWSFSDRRWQLKAASSGIADTGCTTTDYKCLCSASSFTSALQTQVLAECSSADYQSKNSSLVKYAKSVNVDNPATATFAQGVCGGVGVTLNLPSPNNAAAAAPAAAAPASSQATQAAAASVPDDSEGAAANAGYAPTSSYEAGAAPTSTAAVSACSHPTLTLASTSTHTSTYTTVVPSAGDKAPPISFEMQSYTIVQASHTNTPSSSPLQITTTTTTACKKTACTNGTSNATVNTSSPVPFQGKAAGQCQRLQWASAALVFGAVGAFVAL